MGLWTPADSTPEVWLDWSDSTTIFDATSGGSTPVDGGSIWRTEDKSGNGYYFTTDVPSFLRRVDSENSLDCAETVSKLVDHNIDSAGLDVVKNVAGTSIYLVTKSNGSTSSNAPYLYIYGGSYIYISSKLGGQNKLGLLAKRQNSDSRTEIVCSVGAPDVFATTLSSSIIDYTGGTTELYGNGSLCGSGSLASSGNSEDEPATQVNINANSTTAIYCELLLFQEAQTGVAREIVEGYLAHKWGLSALLPADHTYKSQAPTAGGAVGTRRRKQQVGGVL